METLTKRALKERGWTDAGILKFLGEPDYVRPNPKFAKGADMKLYDILRVEDVEGSDEYQEYQAEVAQHKASGRQAASTRKDNIHTKLHTPELSDEELERILGNV